MTQRLADVIDEETAVAGLGANTEFDGRLGDLQPRQLADDIVAVTREALSNVARHARAAAVSIRIYVTDDTVTLEVLDDGTGPGTPNRSSGLINLRRRAERHHGDLRVTERDGGGPHLRWTALHGADGRAGAS